MKVPMGDFALICSHMRTELPFSCECLQGHLTPARLFEPREWRGLPADLHLTGFTDRSVSALRAAAGAANGIEVVCEMPPCS